MSENGTSQCVASTKWATKFMVGALIVLCVTTPPTESSTICGRRLTKMVVQICASSNKVLCGRTPMADPLDRRDNKTGFFGLSGEGHPVKSDDDKPVETKRRKREILSSLIADECCTKNRCSYDYMKTFCCDAR